jgi:hypothetical protein
MRYKNQKIILFVVAGFLVSFSVASAKSFNIFNAATPTQSYFSVDGTSGNVGIGTTGPVGKFQVITGSAAGLIIDSSLPTTPHLRIDGANNLVVDSGTGASSDLYLNYDSNKRVLFGAGNVGVGTVSPNDSFSIGNAGAAPAGSSKTGHNFTSTYLATDDYALTNYGVVKTLIANATSTMPTGANFWGGTLNGNIWNGAAGAGNVGIGTNNPTFKFEVAGASSFGDGPFVIASGANSTSFYDQPTGAYFHTPGAMVRKDSATTDMTQSPATFVLYNKNGTDNSGSKLVFASNETSAAGSNPVTVAAIAAQKVTGTAGSWASGNLKFLVKNGSGYVDAMTINSSGNVGIGTTNPGSGNILNIKGVTPTITTGYGNATGNMGQLVLEASDAYTTQEGGRIAFSGNAGTNGGAFAGQTRQDSVFGTIEGFKANASANNAGGGLIFKTNYNPDGQMYERMRIMDNGNIGIGTSNPVSILSLGGQANPALQINSSSYSTSYPTYLGVRSDASGVLQMGNNANNDFVAGGTAAGAYFRFFVNNTNQFPSAPNGTLAMTINTSGNVGIGTASPNDTFSIGNSGSAPAGSSKTGHNFTSTYLATDDYALVNYGLMKTVLSGGSGALWGGTKDGNIWNGTSGAGNVGIGTSAPSVRLDVQGGGNTYGTNIYGTWTPDSNSLIRNWALNDGSNNYNTVSGAGGTYTSVTDAPMGSKTMRYSANTYFRNGQFVPVDITRTYKVSVWGRTISGTPNNYLSLTQANSDLSTPVNGGWGNPYWGVVNQPFPAAWTYYSMTIGPAGSGADYTWTSTTRYVQLGALMIYSGSGVCELTGYKIEEVPNTIAAGTTGLGNLIVNGNVGVGTAGPGATLHVSYPTTYREVSLTYNAPAAAIIDNWGAQLAMGVSNTGSQPFYLQVRQSANISWPLSLQPLGGNVGIGTANPLSKLQVSGTGKLNWTDGGATSQMGATATIGTKDSTGGSLFVYTAGQDVNWGSGFGVDGDNYGSVNSVINLKAFGVKYAGYYSQMAFHTSNGTTLYERMRIDGAGNVGIGTTAPLDRFSIGNAGTAPAGSANTGHNFTSTYLATDDYALVNYGLMKTVLSGGSGALWSGTKNSNIYNGDAGAGNVGIGTAAPGNKLHIAEASQTEFYGTDNGGPISNLLLQGTDTTRVVGKGPSLTFSFPANTDGSNIWSQARILATPDNNSNGSAIGRLYLQVRDNYNPGVGGSWNWRTGIMIAGNGNVGMGTTAPSARLNIAGPLGSVVGGGGSSIKMTNTDTANYSSIGAGIVGVSNPGMEFSVDGTSRMVIGSTGNVGIGSVNPTAKLVLDDKEYIGADATYGAGYYAVGFGGTANGYNKIFGHTSTSDGLYLAAATGRGIFFRANGGGADNMTVASSGNVGIGTISPGFKLDVLGNIHLRALNATLEMGNGDSNATYGSIGFNNTSNDVEIKQKYSAGGIRLFTNTSSERLTILSGGNVGVNTSAPNDIFSIGNSGTAPAGSANTGHNFTSTYLATDDYALANYGVVKTLVASSISSTLNQKRYDLTPFSYDGTMHYYWNKIAHLDSAYAHLALRAVSQQNTDGNSGQTINEITVTLNGALNAVRVTNAPIASNRYAGVNISVAVDSNRDVWLYSAVSWAPWFYYILDDARAATPYSSITTQEAAPSTAIVNDNETKNITFSTGTVNQSSIVGLVNYDNVNYGLGITNPDAPLHVKGGTAMTSGWNRTATLEATFPGLIFNSNNSKWAGILYDYSSNFLIKVGATSNDVIASGVNALTLNATTGAASFGSSLTAPSGIFNGNVTINASNNILSFNGGGGTDAYVRFADTQIGGQTNGLAYLQWQRDGNQGRRFSVNVSSNAGVTNQALMILENGNVGIGTTAPNDRFSIGNAGTAPAGSANTGHNYTSTYLATDSYALVNYGLLKTMTINAGNATTITSGGDLNMGGFNILAVNKLTVNTIDPLYDINGVKYSTYAGSISGGVKEEVVGKVSINSRAANNEYEAVIDFAKEKEGTNLWVWRQVIDYSADNVEVFMTPFGKFANTYYSIENNKLIFRSDRPVTISYRLIGNRFDWRKWPTRALDQSEKGMKVE